MFVNVRTTAGDRTQPRWAIPGSTFSLAVGSGLVILAVIGVQCVVAVARPGLFAPGHDVPNAVISVLGDGIGEVLVGMVVAARLPRNPVGWILLAFGAVTALLTGAQAVAQAGYAGGGRPSVLAQAGLVIGATTTFAIILTLGLVAALFPSGHIGAGWRRYLVRAFIVDNVVLALASALPAKLDDGIGKQTYPNPIGISSGAGGVAQGIEHVASILGAVLLVVIVGDTLRRGFHARAVERQQLKLFGYAAIAAVVLILVSAIFLPLSSAWTSVGWTVGSNLIAIAIGVALVRYRLYDLDRIVSRTLSYTLVTGLLIGVYIGTVTLTTRALPFSSPVGVAASTLAVAALFSPLRRRVQFLVDRRFNRARCNADATIAAFATRLQAAVDFDSVRGELLQVVNRVIEPTSVSLWIAPNTAR